MMKGEDILSWDKPPQPPYLLPLHHHRERSDSCGSVSAAIPHFYKALQFIKNKRTKYPLPTSSLTKYRLEQIIDAPANMALGIEIKPVIDNRR
jgi:hypothetical protein